jgi:hypothetical protein
MSKLPMAFKTPWPVVGPQKYKRMKEQTEGWLGLRLGFKKILIQRYLPKVIFTLILTK